MLASARDWARLVADVIAATGDKGRVARGD
jgi:hypothetical protein